MRKNLQRSGYGALLRDVKSRIQQARIQAALSVNRDLILLYWDIGRTIVAGQKREGWGQSIVERLANDLHRAFPDMEGFTPRNLWFMRGFYVAYRQDAQNVQQPVLGMAGKTGRTASGTKLKRLVSETQTKPVIGVQPPEPILSIPWGHNILLIQKFGDPALRIWYAQQTIEHGWSRAILLHQIQTEAHRRHGRAVTNFQHTLPPPQSDLAQQVLKDPYNFGFLALGPEVRERELEIGLMEHLSRFLVELGAGFAFVGRQVQLEIGGEDFRLDLLFYHLKLRCFIVIDLKVGPFKAEYAGKMNLYLHAIDAQVSHPNDQPAIGLILCQERNRVVAEYALRGVKKAIGISEYQLTRALPRKLQGTLPTVEEIERELSGIGPVAAQRAPRKTRKPRGS